jgi:hypothetical protein
MVRCVKITLFPERENRRPTIKNLKKFLVFKIFAYLALGKG